MTSTLFGQEYFVIMQAERGAMSRLYISFICGSIATKGGLMVSGTQSFQNKHLCHFDVINKLRDKGQNLGFISFVQFC